jgi:2-polyprenyl-3-methyl-5-hydroxy-6-metoxy-1,4-benzoquinol methylase
VFTNPIPGANELPKYYDSPDYLSHKISKWNFTSFIYNRLRNINLKGKFKLISQYKKSGKILDVGQGTGEFLSYMASKGWEVKGVEPNLSAREFAFENFNLDVVDESGLEEFEASTFDVITMWHVLEHVTDLHKRLKQLKKLVKKDGIIVVAVPNLNSPDSLKYKEKWAALDVPRHLYHFTVDTMNSLLTNFGFEIVSIKPLKLDAYYVSLLSEKHQNNSFPYPAALMNGYKSNKLARKENNYSSMIFVAKQKNSVN